MAEEKNGLEFCFQPFSELRYKADTPIMCLAIEDQPDLILTQTFPEVEATRSRFDELVIRGDETVSISNISRGDSIVPVLLVYIRHPWRKKRHKKQWDLDSINFYREVFGRVAYAVRWLRSMKYTKAVVVLPSRFQPENIKRDRLQERRLEKFVRILAEAITSANRSLDDFKKDKSVSFESVTFTYFGEGGREVDEFFRRSIGEGEIMGEVSWFIRRLTTLPPNAKYPLRFVEEATGAKPSIKSTASKTWHVLRGHAFSSRTKVSFLYGVEGIERFGLGLVTAVGKGSIHEPVFLKVHYRPKTDRQKSVRRVVVIGKGVTFDTGGLDLKTGEQLHRMHYDMASGATAIGLVKLAESMDLPVEIVVLVPLVENAIGPYALCRHDIVTAYDGQTVEIADTDAEGRLIMADAVAYAERHLRADLTITIGNLCDIRDLGPDLMKVAVGNRRLYKRVLRAEFAACEKVFPMPPLEHLNWVYNEHIGSISDLLNEPTEVYYHVAPLMFLYHFFIGENPEWIFVDISSVFEDDADDYGTGPGFGLKFVWYLIKQLA